MKHSVKHQRRSEAQIMALLDLQQKQDIPVTAFCRAHNIQKATFYNWRNKYTAKPAAAQEFVRCTLLSVLQPLLPCLQRWSFLPKYVYDSFSRLMPLILNLY